MKRCPKCNRTYSTDTQKFCTHDGGLLAAVEAAVEEDLGQTVKFDSSKVRDAVHKPTTRDLSAEQAAAFDPEATVVSSKVIDGTQQVKPRDTGNLEPPSQTQYYGAPPSAPSTGPMSPSAAPTVVGSAPPVPSEPLPPTPTSAPAQTSAPLPPTQVVSSEPVAPSTGPIPPAQTQAAAAAQTSQPLPPAVPKKRSKLPLILGILAVLLVFFVGAVAAAGYFLWYKPQQLARARERVVITEPSQPSTSLPPDTTASPSQASIPSNEPEPYNPPADAVQFVNSQEALKGKLAENFVAFSFYYPNRWEKDPKAGTGGSANFVEVHRQLDQSSPQESMAVSWYDLQEFSFEDLAKKKSAQLEEMIGQYRKVSEGPTKVGTYEGYELRFEGRTERADKSEMSIWGRVVWLPVSQGSKTGVALLMYATSLTPDVRSIDEVGVKGELPMLLESFRFGN